MAWGLYSAGLAGTRAGFPSIRYSVNFTQILLLQYNITIGQNQVWLRLSRMRFEPKTFTADVEDVAEAGIFIGTGCKSS